MLETLFDQWCDSREVDVSGGHKLHLLSEKEAGRAFIESKLNEMVASHYDDPERLVDRIARLGYVNAAQILKTMLPTTKRARSGHLGEILATESVPALLRPFKIPIKRLRWLDGRESALRGEDLIGLATETRSVRFLKGESKSRKMLTPSVLNEAREALNANEGRPSQHAMGFIMKILYDQGQDELARIFEDYLLVESIPANQLVHLVFGLSGNDASAALEADLHSCNNGIEQHAVALCIPDHQEFIASVYERLNSYAS
jgi:hypothetical protein